jgi:TRAP-type C4-dicarboxylate transport system substrate-binding protein
MKKRIFFVLLLAGILIFTCMSKEAKSQTIVIRGVTAFPRTHIINDYVPEFIEAVSKRTQGRLKINWLGGPEVFPAFDQIHALKGGTIDMIIHFPLSYSKSLMPEADLMGLSQLAAWEERKSGAFELWSEILAKKVNAKYLGKFQSLNQFFIYSNKKVEKIGDFKGLNIRVMPLYIPFIKALGANPVTLPPTDIYTSMERGVVDGFIISKPGMTGFGLQEVTKYWIEPGFFQIEPSMIMNLDFWNKIPKDLQDLLMDAVKDNEYIATMRFQMLARSEEVVMRKAGMRTLTLSPEDTAKFLQVAYDSTWEYLIKAAPEYGPKLRKLTVREALPKGAFPW